MGRGVGDIFQEETKHTRGKVRGARADEYPALGLYKEYADASRLPLPPPPQVECSLDRTLKQRKSVRSYAGASLSQEELAYLLWASTGIQRVEEEREFRTAPSAGALYPIETYLVVNNVEGIPQGVYHYAIRRHALEELRSGGGGDGAENVLGGGGSIRLDGRFPTLKVAIPGPGLPVCLSGRGARSAEPCPGGGQPRSGVVPDRSAL